MDFKQTPVKPVRPDAAFSAARIQSSAKLSKKKLLLIAASVLLLAAIAFGIFNYSKSNASGYIDDGKYQAVFLSNGQVYFGKLSLVNDQYVKMNDIYYLRMNDTLQAAPKEEGDKPAEGSVAGASSEPQLVKLGNEVHGPQDEMIVNRDQVLFWENLKDEGTVSKSIKDYIESQKKD